jgi:hypothetical protein
MGARPNLLGVKAAITGLRAITDQPGRHGHPAAGIHARREPASLGLTGQAFDVVGLIACRTRR